MYDLTFLLIPIGLCLLAVSIRSTVRLARPEKVYEMPYADRKGTFTIGRTGKYSVWLNGKQLQRMPIGAFGLLLTNCDTRQAILLSKPLLPAHVNGARTGRVELYGFEADAGTYVLERNDLAGTGDRVRQSVADVFSRKPVDSSLLSFQVYRQTSKVALFLSIVGIVIGFMAFGLGILFPVIFPRM
ncbi:MAG: hypothetical protein K6A82_05035 [Prevotella sp.]|nr:hypothetical protein [Prevotella sp.]